MKEVELKSLGKNYLPGRMSWADGFLSGRIRSEMALEGGGCFMLFDMKKAKQIAKALGLQGIESIRGGLDGDFGENSCTIYDGKWHKYDAYEGSPWATPIILVEFKDKPMEAFECWSPQDEH